MRLEAYNNLDDTKKLTAFFTTFVYPEQLLFLILEEEAPSVVLDSVHAIWETTTRMDHETQKLRRQEHKQKKRRVALNRLHVDACNFSSHMSVILGCQKTIHDLGDPQGVLRAYIDDIDKDLENMTEHEHLSDESDESDEHLSAIVRAAIAYTDETIGALKTVIATLARDVTDLRQSNPVAETLFEVLTQWTEKREVPTTVIGQAINEALQLQVMYTTHTIHAFIAKCGNALSNVYHLDATFKNCVTPHYLLAIFCDDNHYRGHIWAWKSHEGMVDVIGIRGSLQHILSHDKGFLQHTLNGVNTWIRRTPTCSTVKVLRVISPFDHVRKLLMARGFCGEFTYRQYRNKQSNPTRSANFDGSSTVVLPVDEFHPMAYLPPDKESILRKLYTYQESGQISLFTRCYCSSHSIE
jgi:hypothetical protein